MKLNIFFCLGLALSTLTSPGAEIDNLAGKWTCQRTNQEGRVVTLTLDIKKDKLVFQMLNSSKEVSFHAEGTAKAEKAGPFSVLKLTQIKAGDSATNAESTSEERTSIYQLRDDELFLATNFEAERSQKPALDCYRKVTK